MFYTLTLHSAVFSGISIKLKGGKKKKALAQVPRFQGAPASIPLYTLKNGRIQNKTCLTRDKQ